MPSYKGWLDKAKSDLRIAKKGVKDDDFTLDTAIYHTQQCAEKALKGYLSYHSKPLEKTHDLLKLLENCCSIDDEFKTLSTDLAILSPFATEFRYPVDDEILLERAVVLDAINRAQKVLVFTETKIQTSKY